MAITGLTTTGPLVHWLVHKLEMIAPGSNPSAIMTKVFLNCCFMPVMFSAALGSTSLLEGNDVSGACRKVRLSPLTVFVGIDNVASSELYEVVFVFPAIKSAYDAGKGRAAADMDGGPSVLARSKSVPVPVRSFFAGVSCIRKRYSAIIQYMIAP